MKAGRGVAMESEGEKERAIDELFEEFDDDDYGNIDNESARSMVSAAESAARANKRKSRKMHTLPDKFQPIYQRATSLYLDGKYEEALTVFAEIALAAKSYAPVHNFMADCYENLGRSNDAFESCKKAVQIDPTFLEAWARYIRLAERIDADTLLSGLVKYVQLSSEGDNLASLPMLRRLVDILQWRKHPKLPKFQRLLLQLEYKAGNYKEAFEAGANIARDLFEQGKSDLVWQCMQPTYELGKKDNVDIPYDFLVLYVESLLHCDRVMETFTLLLERRFIQVPNTASPEVNIKDIPSVQVPPDCSFLMTLAVCTVMIRYSNYDAVRHLIESKIDPVAEFPPSKLVLRYTHALKEQKYYPEALAALKKIHNQPEFRSPELYFQLGEVYEAQNELKLALDAFNRAVSLRPGFRAARLRVRSLGLPVPRASSLTTPENSARTVIIQKRIFEEFLKETDESEIVRLAVDLAASTFQHLEAEDEMRFAREKENVLGLYAPTKMDSVVKDILQYAPAIASSEIPLESFWDVIIKGCTLAFKSNNLQDFFDLLFYALCTMDFRPYPEKVDALKFAMLTATYRWGEYEFVARYYRDKLTESSKPTLSVTEWNFFHQLVADGEYGASLTKWGQRWIKMHDYCREVVLLMANDPFRRGNYRHALELYRVCLDKEGIKSVPWNILLHLGILYINLACQRHCAQRLSLYNTGRVFLEKYGWRRGHCPEVLYNKARAAQQFGDRADAAQLYTECLDLCSRTLIGKQLGAMHRDALNKFSFRAAYNLRAIHMVEKNYLFAKDVTQKHLKWSTVRACIDSPKQA
ncbi:hypothetical protein RvY_04295 [Ramazzottius varieornatus]|uniref:Uncharacterized protein n=1 Tax=Ramazzottius varieornatus TaxID=947166 RepID=A0A1D1UWX4_RAMVA|nr:hypothetical protein RvY_04295 [Ramazzottius varieornatus]